MHFTNFCASQAKCWNVPVHVGDCTPVALTRWIRIAGAALQSQANDHALFVATLCVVKLLSIQRA
jgi:hypothetical protein